MSFCGSPVRSRWLVRTSPLIAMVGVEDLIVVASGSDVLILPRGRSQDVKLLLQESDLVMQRVVRPQAGLGDVEQDQCEQVRVDERSGRRAGAVTVLGGIAPCVRLS